MRNVVSYIIGHALGMIIVMIVCLAFFTPPWYGFKHYVPVNHGVWFNGMAECYWFGWAWRRVDGKWRHVFVDQDGIVQIRLEPCDSAVEACMSWMDDERL